MFANNDLHSILIAGPSGCGKTYLASVYAHLLNISTFNCIDSTVSSLKQAIQDSYALDDRQVVCIENLDLGTNAASQILLKYIEEPTSKTYVVVTCRNMSKLPSTIASRSVTLFVPPPSMQDLELYADSVFRDNKEYRMRIMQFFCKSLADVVNFSNTEADKLVYYSSAAFDQFWKQSVDQIIWGLTHFEDGSPTDLKVMLYSIYRGFKDENAKQAALDALTSLEQNKVSKSAVVGKFVLDVLR